MKKLNTILYILILSFLITGCADVSPNAIDCVNESSYGFFGGLWHGLISIFSFIGSLFMDDVAVYAYNNNGVLYDFGFLLGVGAFASRTYKSASK